MTKYNSLMPERLLALFNKPEPPATITEAAIGIGVRRETFITWVNGHPEFKTAFLQCKALVLQDLEQTLYKRAMGYDVTEEEEIREKRKGGSQKETTTQMRVVTRKKHIPADVTALRIALRAMDPEKYNDRQELEVGINPQSWMDLFDIAAAKQKQNNPRASRPGSAALPEESGRVD